VNYADRRWDGSWELWGQESLHGLDWNVDTYLEVGIMRSPKLYNLYNAHAKGIRSQKSSLSRPSRFSPSHISPLLSLHSIRLPSPSAPRVRQKLLYVSSSQPLFFHDFVINPTTIHPVPPTQPTGNNTRPRSHPSITFLHPPRRPRPLPQPVWVCFRFSAWISVVRIRSFQHPQFMSCNSLCSIFK
jgi:hypothetical protein